MALNSTERQIAVALGPLEWISRYGPPRPLAAPPRPGQQRGYRRPDLETEFEAPNTDLEIGVASLFHEALGINDVGIDDNFSDLGGHSLLGVQLVNRIQQRFSIEIGIGELFGLSTVRSLARTIEARAGEATPSVPAEDRLAASNPCVMQRGSAPSFDAGPWILRRPPRQRAEIRLFCLPHAGGDTGIFHHWHRVLRLISKYAGFAGRDAEAASARRRSPSCALWSTP